MKVKGIFPITILLAFLLFFGAFMPAASLAADVDVYIKGAHTATYLDVFVFADIDPSVHLISWGVTLNYETDELNPISAEKNLYPNVPYTSNQARWELGDGTNKDLPNPDFESVAGKVIGKGGVLNVEDPTAGISGQGVLLFKVRFEPGVIDPNLSQPNLWLTYAVGNGEPEENYKNFVKYDSGAGVVLDSTGTDGVNFRAINVTETMPPGALDIAEYGDANGDRSINSTDYIGIRNLLANPYPPPYADCNQDGFVNSTDYICIRNKL